MQEVGSPSYDLAAALKAFISRRLLWFFVPFVFILQFFVLLLPAFRILSTTGGDQFIFFCLAVWMAEMVRCLMHAIAANVYAEDFLYVPPHDIARRMLIKDGSRAPARKMSRILLSFTHRLPSLLLVATLSALEPFVVSLDVMMDATFTAGQWSYMFGAW